MNGFVPSGYITVEEAVDSIGREMFDKNWRMIPEERDVQYRATLRELRTRLEDERVAAAVIDPGTGAKEKCGPYIWRRYDADWLLERGRAPIFWGSYYRERLGTLVIKTFQPELSALAPADATEAQLGRVIEFLLRPESRAESLTRAQQRELVDRAFQGLRIVEKQWRHIHSRVPGLKGRPPKPVRNPDGNSAT